MTARKTKENESLIASCERSTLCVLARSELPLAAASTSTLYAYRQHQSIHAPLFIFAMWAFALVAWASSPCAATIYYVDDDSPPTNLGGQSWNDSFKYPQDALDAASTGQGHVIKVAGGSYRPDQEAIGSEHIDNDPSETFFVPPTVQLQGGYAGLAFPSNPDERIPSYYKSRLTGEIGNTAIVIDNSRHVVKIGGTGFLTVLDGLYIERGYGNDSLAEGVGIWVEVAGATPSIKGCTVQFHSNVNGNSQGAGI